MQKQKILLIEDEEDIAALIKLQADISGYKFLLETDGVSGLRTAERELPHLILLDIMLPGMNGLDVCRKIKVNPELRTVPIILISAKSEELDVILGLELGADDYVTKPFSPKVLFSRIKAVLRRRSDAAAGTAAAIGQQLSFGSFVVDLQRYQVKKQGIVIPLTLSEFGILRKLVKNRGNVLTRNQLLDDLQSDDTFVIDRNIDVHIASLRKKLGPGFEWIETVRGVGYRFREPSEAI